MTKKIKKYRFLFEELVKRDFKKKYKGTALGMLWSGLGPLLNLVVMAVVFTHLFGRNEEHYIIYLFCGNVVFSFFSESTSLGMRALSENAHIFTKINVPKYMFVISKNVTALINFGINLCIMFIFVAAQGIEFHWNFLLLLYPVACLIILNLGVGFILSALFLMFRDVAYFYEIFLSMFMYLSAIFYYVDLYPEEYRSLFMMNPIYVYITYFRDIIIYNTVPDMAVHFLCIFDAVILFIVGAAIYKKNNYKFLYYV